MRISLAKWTSAAKRIVKEYGVNLLRPEGFSTYLLAIYGPQRDEETSDILGRHITTITSGSYAAQKAAWMNAIAPKGALVFRGLSDLNLTQHGLLEQMASYHDGNQLDNFSMNVAYDVPHFTRSFRGGKYERDGALIIHKMVLKEFVEFGGDSESGDAAEAEVKMKKSLPMPPDRVFVHSVNKKLGRAVSKSDIQQFTLEERIVCQASFGGMKFPLYIHPAVDRALLKGCSWKMVKNKPSSGSWMEIDSAELRKGPSSRSPSCRVTRSRKALSIECGDKASAEAALELIQQRWPALR